MIALSIQHSAYTGIEKKKGKQYAACLLFATLLILW